MDTLSIAIPIAASGVLTFAEECRLETCCRALGCITAFTDANTSLAFEEFRPALSEPIEFDDSFAVYPGDPAWVSR